MCSLCLSGHRVKNVLAVLIRPRGTRGVAPRDVGPRGVGPRSCNVVCRQKSPHVWMDLGTKMKGRRSSEAARNRGMMRQRSGGQGKTRRPRQRQKKKGMENREAKRLITMELRRASATWFIRPLPAMPGEPRGHYSGASAAGPSEPGARRLFDQFVRSRRPWDENKRKMRQRSSKE